jgi:hypothetical protein
VYERDRDRSFADKRRYAFDIACANIPGGKNTGQAGFEQVGPATERPLSPVNSSYKRSGPVSMKPLGIQYRNSFEMINAFEDDKFRVYQYGDVRVCSMRRMRYFDIVSMRPEPLTIMYTVTQNAGTGIVGVKAGFIN